MRAALALGSNLPSSFGDPTANLREALRRLRFIGNLLGVSELRETEPVGFLDQPRFLNAAALLETSLGPQELLGRLLALEEAMGRVRRADLPPKGPRVIDLDLLLFEDEQGRSVVLNEPDLILPHPEMHTRRFVLEPLAEISPAMWHPVLHTHVASLLGALNAAESQPAGLEHP